ncbi:MAG TPA: error-prone DNA polymerase [Puia sp.]|nr:error-prone DNA polymerase [Puia sp.]
MSYTELQVTSNFSFLRGASHPEELVTQAAALGHKAIAITDRNTLAGIVRAHSRAKKENIRILPGTRLDLLDGPSLLALPTDKAAYGRLSGLLTLGNRRAEKGECHLYKTDVYAHAQGIRFVIIPPDSLNSLFDFEASFQSNLQEYREALKDQCHLAATRYYHGDDSKQLFRLAQLSKKLDLPLVATNDVHYHVHTRRQLQDIITCIREKCTIYNAGFRLHPNAERHMKTIPEMQRLFRQYPGAIAATQDIADACRFSLDSLEYVYPDEITSEGRTPMEELILLVWQGARQIYGEQIPDKIKSNIKHELEFIGQMNYPAYFLTVYDAVRYARQQGILCQGRGSAANSTICYCLGITSVDPTKFELLFERFLSAARNEPPDIDVDFQHDRREEVIQYIYNKYGRDRAGIVATVTQVHAKGAIRDVGKAMGLSVDAVDRLSKSIHEFSDQLDPNLLKEQGLGEKETHLEKVLELTAQYIGFPRQLGQHTGGFVITRGKLTDLCPILNARMEDRTNIEWNKDDIDLLRFLKVDFLALGMLTALRKTFDLAKQQYDLDLTLANIPQDDPAIYEMCSHADTVGVFQIESRAQQSMLPRLRPKCFYDLVISVAIVRPGPIQGDMVNPYLRRRNGIEPVEFPSKELKDILGRTLGVPLFQEQAMKIAIDAGGFTPSEADDLRRSMATFKAHGKVSAFREKLVTGMIRNGYAEEYAQRVFRQLEGFGSYGFPESHAVSFALLAYISAWLKWYYPDIFLCALLNSQPMGFYSADQLITCAQNHDVRVRPVDINRSDWDNTIEEQDGRFHAVRLGFRQIEGIREEEMFLLMARRIQPYRTIRSLQDAGLSQLTLEKLADADAFNSIGLDRREAMWQVAALNQSQYQKAAKATMPVPSTEGRALTLFDDHDDKVTLPQMTASEHVVQDYATMSLSLKGHPISFVRDNLIALGVCTAKEHRTLCNGQYIKVAGLVRGRQCPPTAKGTCFITLEDETGNFNCVAWASIFEEYRKPILSSKFLMIEGHLQIEGEVIHIIAQRCQNLNPLLGLLTPSPDEDLPVLPDPEIHGAQSLLDQSQRIKPFPEGRNFK